jgi:hypothetical protein
VKSDKQILLILIKYSYIPRGVKNRKEWLEGGNDGKTREETKPIE